MRRTAWILALLCAVLITLVSGFLLVRLDGASPLRSPQARQIAYWAHVAGPLLAGAAAS